MADIRDIELRPLGIAEVLRDFRLKVPSNQRPYAWRAEHVTQLFDDWVDAFSAKNSPHYFLGTIVLNRAPDGDIVEVSDGQQRLATTAIFLAAIRDVLAEQGTNEKTTAEKYTRSFLIEFEELEGDWMERLKLNTQDNIYFRDEILVPAAQRDSSRIKSSRRSSNERLAKAYEMAKQRVENIMNSVSADYRIRHLYEWVRFLSKQVIVFVITVPEDIDAFTMFETLNDRGLKASQVDNIKNRFFREAGGRLSEAEELWLSMIAQIESFGDDSTIIAYLRHYWISEHGPTREGELAKKIKQQLKGQAQVATFLRRLDDHVVDYEALFFSPLDHKRLNDLTPNTRGFVAAITRVLGIEQIRPLMLAILRSFTPQEAEKAFKMLLSWSVRFLVVGTGGGGLLDRNYGALAEQVSSGELVNAKALREAASHLIPGDTQFVAQFRTHTVSDTDIARYICRSFEAAMRAETNPSIVFFENPQSANLEHVLPRKPNKDWHLRPDEARAFYKRVGNLTLLDPQVNTEIGNSSFDQKKLAYGRSPFRITQDLARYEEWGPDMIEERQSRLASLAPSIWTLR